MSTTSSTPYDPSARSTHTTEAGDTFEKIARKVYGDEREAHRLRDANPGTVEPFASGIVLTVPAVPDAPTDTPQRTAATNQNEVAVMIDGKRFRFWQSVRITRAVDNMDTLELVAPFDADVKSLRKTFRPFSYKRVTVTVGGVTLFTGTMVGVVPGLTPQGKTVSVSAYSLPGVLNDCTPPASAFGEEGNKLEFRDQNLREIATALAGFFGISVKFDAEPGANFDLETLGGGKKVLPFLAKLAKQQNLVISSTPRGELLFLKSSDAGQPAAQLRQGESPLISVTPFFSPQEYYSHITGVAPVLVGQAGSQFTVKNPRLAGVLRPFTFAPPDADSAAAAKKATKSKAGRMFGNAASYSVTVSTWRDVKGRLWRPDSTVNLHAHDAMVYLEYAFIVRSVEFRRERNAETAVLNLVMPGAFSGKIPERMPWD